MKKSRYYHYYVEGDTEEKIVSILKTEYQLIVPGKIEKFNVVNKKLSAHRTMVLKDGTTVVLVFDIDTNNSDILDENIAFLNKQKNIHKVICITQVNNLEDELKRSCKIKNIKELTGSLANKDFKRDMLKHCNFKRKLDENHFDFSNFWVSVAQNNFSHICNESGKIKK